MDRVPLFLSPPPLLSSTYGYPIVLAEFVKLIIISSLNCLSTLVKKINWFYICRSISVLCSVH